MSKIYVKMALCCAGLLLMFLTSGQVLAQCDNLTLSLTKTNSTCLANGKIKVTVSGADLPNIEQSTMEFQVSGDKDIAFTHYTDNTILNLPAGTYTIHLRAFCKVTNDWIVATTSSTTTITTSYKEMNYSFGRIIPTLNCKPTGIIPVSIESGTGSSPFTIEITSKPAAYTGTTTFTFASRNYDISDLPAGDYTIRVSDDCGYTISNRTVTVGAMSQDYYNVFQQKFYPAGTVANACDQVSAYRIYIDQGTDPDNNYYFWSKSANYFEVAFVFNNTGTKTWQPLTSSTYNMNITLPSPHTMGSMRGSSNYMAVYLRVKGCTMEHQLPNITLDPDPLSVVNQRASGCDQIDLELYPWSDYDGTICFPYEWRIIKTSDNSVFLDWQGPVANRNSQYAYNVPTGSLRVEFKDAEGYTWSSNISVTTPPKPYLNSSTSISYSNLEPDGVYRSRIYPYFYPNLFPVGTTFKFISGPTIPTHQTGTLSTSSSYIYPYTVANFTNSSYVRLEPGTYQFEVTRPGCVSDTITTSHTVYSLASKPTYTLTEECDGLSVTFTGGGQLQYTSSNGVVSNTGTPYIRIGATIPSSIVYDNTKVVTHGGSLKLPVAGKYVIYLGTSNSSTNTAIYRDTIVYTPTPFTLDNAVTSAYLCQGESTGFIRVKGAGGTGNYKYELYDNDVLKFTNTTGVFNYGVGGGTYKIILYDTQCGYSYPQDVTLIDLGIAQIAYSSSPDNKYCVTDSIYLKCLTMGETTYTWSGPGITAANKNKQNPAIAASDVGIGIHTYTITVTPESCGTEMTQTVTVTVQDCSGAHDDYATLFVNTFDTIDVLANDAFPASCAGSVVPVVTVGPTQGSYTVVNKKVVYKPNTGFIGKDSLTYRTTCSSDITYAKVYINVIPYPDNVVDADCYITPPASVWSFKELGRSSQGVSTVGNPLAGDIDNDGRVEIVTVCEISTYSTVSKLYIFDDQLNVKYTITLADNINVLANVYSMADVDGDGYAEIFICGIDGYLYKFKHNQAAYNGQNYVMENRVQHSTDPKYNYCQPMFTDFNGDGYPEVVVLDKIYDANTLTLLVDGNRKGIGDLGYGAGHATTNTSSNKTTGMMTIGDIDGDGLPELIAGSSVYKVTINSRTNASQNSFVVYSQANKVGRDEVGDGATALADMDLDGMLDVVVSRRYGTNRAAIYIWNPRTGEIMNTNIVKDLYVFPANSLWGPFGPSIPFLGDIDGDGKPEVVVVSHRTGQPNSSGGMVTAYDFESGVLIKKTNGNWPLQTTDYSAATAITLFDFNQDDKSELVYRDCNHLRILNGETADDLVTPLVVCGSATGQEYPIVVDYNNDGSAEIIVTGHPTSVSDGALNGYLRIFGSNGSKWAPARKVWNQYVYNAVNVNEDLTIPQYQVNPATIFPGDDGVLGTPDDVRPYNAFLQQQTFLNKNGTPLWLTPNGEVTGVHAFNYDVNADSLTVTIEVRNIGDAAFQPPFYITTYKNNVGGTPKHTINYDQAILPGEIVSITFGIPNFTQNWYPFNNIIIQINDNGDGDNDQAVCDDANRFFKTTNIIASDDRILIFTDDVNRPIEVTLNDILPIGCTNPIVQVLSVPSYTGTVSVSGSDILYTPAAGITVDTLRYRIHCGDVSKVDTATVYINIIEKPDNIVDADCYTIPSGSTWSIREQNITAQDVHNFTQPFVGDLDGCGKNEVIAFHPTSVHTSNRLFIFDDQLQLKDAIDIPLTYTFLAYPIAIADVDRDGKPEIFILTGNTATRTLQCYYHNGTTYVAKPGFTPSTMNVPVTTTTYQASISITIGDINRDGVPELLVYDRVLNSRTGAVIATLPTGSRGTYNAYMLGLFVYYPVLADVDNDGILDIVAGNMVYRANINVGSTSGTVTLAYQAPTHANVADGFTSVADIDLDGYLDVVVTHNQNNVSRAYVWSPYKGRLLGQVLTGNSSGTLDDRGNISRSFIGDVDNDGYPEVAFSFHLGMACYGYNPVTEQFDQRWRASTNDVSGLTSMTMFDFNQDDKQEIVYRDEKSLRIINGETGGNITTFPCYSGTASEMPIVVDLTGEGHAQILVSGSSNVSGGVRLRRYVSNGSFWAPARKVWNQYAYNAVNVNEDLTIPQYQVNPATVFPGDDGVLGTPDDVRPYNAFLQQQTILSKDGVPIWLTPDVYPDPLLVSSSVVGDSVSITIGIVNQGDAAIGSPVYVSLYKESVSSSNYMITDSAEIQIAPGGTGYVTVRIPDMTLFPALNIVVRVNDDGTKFTYQPECDDTNNTITIQNPALHLFMKKDATLLLSPPFAHNGTYPNPVSVLFSENIKYEITAKNVSTSSASIQICDTLPAYLKYRVGSENPTTNFSKTVTSSGVPEREILTWIVPGVAAGSSVKVSFEATPVDGSCASQPLYINKAWVTLGSLKIPTGNSTYHQGAGIGVATFSSGLGGQLYNAEPQAVDYRTTARSGILVVPDEGYEFSGWSHGDYTSLRGDHIRGQKGIMHYDTLTIYGNVELEAHFSPEVYPVRYYLNGASNASVNPDTYTVETGLITLASPEKSGDVFLGWSGSNGPEPQSVVTIPEGSTGELAFYANFLYSGREKEKSEPDPSAEKIWSVKEELFIYTLQVGSFVRIYSPDGMLIRHQELKTIGETKMKLPRGIYIVTLNNNVGQKVWIE